MRTTNVSAASATVELDVIIDNDSNQEAGVEVVTRIFTLNEQGEKQGQQIAAFDPVAKKVVGNSSVRSKVQ